MKRNVKALIIVKSVHLGNTEKLGRAMAGALGAPVAGPEATDPDMLGDYDLIGFGSGIYSDRHDQSIYDIVEKLPDAANKSAFIFSTSGIPSFLSGRQAIETYCFKCHVPLRKMLTARGYSIVGEFGCAGHNRNSFLKLFGGFNKGRPDAADLKRAETFANNLRSLI